MDWLIIVPMLVIAVAVSVQLALSNHILETLRQTYTLLDERLPKQPLHPQPRLTNYSTWTYRNPHWELVETNLEPGFVAGDPPRRPGAYVGETVRRPAVRGS